ncbi:DUF4129 domain-containing protein [Frigoribacterium faeni]|uniref:DUF4129 domain-containing protein n=1 Tax=Frigoribacterium faeni TaxID=145483 RepID=UPI00141AB5F1|nr:DUF4129 domain-containing protein [Frigoribacterium faeni]NIJ04131.1 hypothetical protein [Frigoribacterium faeni]
MTPTTTALAAAPLDPDPDEARGLLLRELTGRDYVAAQPTWLDRAADAFWSWLNGIRFGGVEGAPAVALVVLLVVVVVALVVVLAVYGVPRLNRRSARGPELFGEGDDRDADRLRRAATAAAASGDLVLAVTESFRALARALVERDALATTPGTTARTVGDRAGRRFPELADRLAAAAASFDGVRYLDRPGTEAAWREIVELDAELEQKTPVAAS